MVPYAAISPSSKSKKGMKGKAMYGGIDITMREYPVILRRLIVACLKVKIFFQFPFLLLNALVCPQS